MLPFGDKSNHAALCSSRATFPHPLDLRIVVGEPINHRPPARCRQIIDTFEAVPNETGELELLAILVKVVVIRFVELHILST